jgi:hypothetical protein
MEALKHFPTKEHLERQEVIREALTWMGTPFMHEARVKGVGCDCGRFLIAIYSSLGHMENYEPYRVPVAWHLHSEAPGFDPEMYIRQIKRFAREIEGPPAPGDIAMFWWGKAYSHSGIVIEWPNKMIHCFFIAGVQLVDAQIDPYLKRFLSNHPPRFFTVWGKP